MIQKISFQNYKAFEKGEIKIKPITILLGANSVGKSSIINLLLMLQQTANSRNYKSALRLHGENVSMGECENIFRNKKTENNIVIGFDFNNSTLLELLKGGLLEDFIDILFQPIELLSSFPDYRLKNNINININQFLNQKQEIDTQVYASKQKFIKLYTTIESIMNNSSNTYSDKLRYYLINIKKEVLLNEKKHIELLYDFLRNVKDIIQIEDETFNLSFELLFTKSNKKEDVLKIKKVSLIYKKHSILDIELILNKNNSTYE
ncbi:AAA family ATPase, partial [Bacteroides sp. An322]|uniref:AAA family ATPase n=1 Tax=Bacteroides sp. An322 TaxID=1965632 RepID=UPI000B5794CF